MKLAFNVTKLRGTIFTSQISYSPALVEKLSAVLKGYLPSFVTVLPQNNSIPNGIIQNFWEMVSTHNGERIQFNNIKIDIVRVIDVPYSEEVISEFCSHCAEIFNTICSVSKQNSSRLAIAPTFTCVDSDDNIKSFAQEVFVKKAFKESRLDNCLFNNIFRVNEKIGENQYLINYLANVYASNRIESIDGNNVIRESISVDFDINTFANAKYVFEAGAINDFFAVAPNMCREFFNFYFK